MCYRSLHLPSNKRCYATGVDNHYNTFACGSCPDCQRNQANEWYVRMYAEFLSHIKKGGMVIAPTFTYNDNNVPSVTLGGYRFKCFNKKHMQDFMKRFRSDPLMKDTTIRYIWCSEYGKNSTKRPHYHAVFFLSKKHSIKDLLRVITKHWWYGYVGISKKHGLQVRGIAGCKYCSKYVCKDISYFDTYAINDMRVSLRDYLYHRTPKDNPESRFFNKPDKLRFKELRQNGGQFHEQSMQFGFHLYDMLGFGVKSVEDIKNAIDKGTIMLPNESTPYKIPKYLLRRLFKRYNPVTGLWDSTDFHLDYLRRNSIKRLDSVYDIMYQNIYDDRILEFVDDPAMESCLIDVLNNLRSCNIRELSRYSILRNIDKPTDDDIISKVRYLRLYANIENLQVEQAMNNAPDFGEPIYNSKDFQNTPTFADAPFLKHLECLYQDYLYLNSLWSLYKEQAYTYKQARIAELRALNNQTNFINYSNETF